MTPLPQNSLEDARRQLANCVLFRGLVTGEWDAIVDRARIRHFVAGEPIFLMGSPGASMMAVLTCPVPVLERRDVFEFLERQPNAWPRIVDVLCDRLRATDPQMAEVAMQQLP